MTLGFRALCAELLDCLEKADWPFRHRYLFRSVADRARAVLLTTTTWKMSMIDSLPWSTEPNVSGRYLYLRDGVFRALYDVNHYSDPQMGIAGQWEATEVCTGTRVVRTVTKLQPAHWLLLSALPLPSGEVE